MNNYEKSMRPTPTADVKVSCIEAYKDGEFVGYVKSYINPRSGVIVYIDELKTTFAQRKAITTKRTIKNATSYVVKLNGIPKKFYASQVKMEFKIIER